MRPLYCVAAGDSLTQAAGDEADLGGYIGRLVDWALTQGLNLWFQGRGPVKNHIAPAANIQWHEAFGGLEISQLEASLSNRLDQNKLPTGFPTFGTSANSIYRPIDFFIWAGGANNANNAGQTAEQINAADLSYLRTLRAALDPMSPNARIVVMGGLTDWGDAAAHTKLVAVNAARAADVYDVFDAENPTNTLIRLDWYTLAGPYNVTDWVDLVHFKAAVYDRIMNTAGTGMIAVLGPILLAAAQTDIAMGTLSTYAKNKLIDHMRNVAAYTPAATHYLHLYADAACTVPLTSGTASGYVAIAKTNNTTTWSNLASRIKANGAAFTFAAATGTWPDVLGWKLTDSATEGAGNVLASDSHTAVPVSVATGPISYAIGAITITAATNVSTGGWTDAAAAELMNLMFGATANVPRVTVYGSYWAGDPAGAGTIAGSSVAITQASTWGAAANGRAVTVADVTLTQQATGTYWAEHSAAAGAGTLLYTAPRPASVGAAGTILTGQLQTTIS